MAPTQDASAPPLERVLPSELAAGRQARRLASRIAAPLMSSEQLSKLELAVTEVVTNAVRHSGSGEGIRLAIAPLDGYLCVRVTDGGRGLVPRPGAMASEEGGGYGLFLVERLTRRWGVTREGGRTRVWFEIDYRSSASLSPSGAPA